MKKLFFLLSVAVALAACGGISFEIKIPKSLIVSQLDSRFPFTKNKGLMTVTVSDPVLNFNGSSNRLEVKANTVVRILGLIPIKGNVLTDGTLEYRPATATFHFKEVKIKEFNIKGIPESQLDQVTGLLGTVMLAVLGDIEVYKLNPTDTKENIGRLGLKGIRMVDDGVMVRLGIGG